MPRRITKKKPSLLAPAGNLLKSLSNAESRLRRQVLRLGLWGLAGLFVVTLLFGNYSLVRIVKLQLSKSTLIESNRRLTTNLIDAVRTREMLLHDPYYIEQIARSRYYMVRPGETIYRYRGR
jgi:cell division protein FtsB